MAGYRQDINTFRHVSNVRILQAIEDGFYIEGGGWWLGMFDFFEPIAHAGALPTLQMSFNNTFRGVVRVEYNSDNDTYNCLFDTPYTQEKAVFSVLERDLFDTLDRYIRRNGMSLESYENAILSHTFQID